MNGQMPPVFPALAGSNIVMNDKAKNIEILMEGVQGAAMQSLQINCLRLIWLQL